MIPTQPNADELGDWLAGLPEQPGVRPLDALPPGTPSRASASFRRVGPPGTLRADAPEQQIISLVREGDVLRWRLGASPLTYGGRRAGSRAALPPGRVVKQYAFETLKTSQVYTALERLDQLLTPDASYPDNARNGLRRWRNGRLEPFADPTASAGKRVLLFIHGTFSKSEALLGEGLAAIKPGAKLLADAEKHYDLVLAYDHPTLSVSPLLNAFDLAALLRPAPASLDIVCHSRGGLVARWFCEAVADPALGRRVVFVGSPLAGTSLAAPPNLRHTLDLLTNIANALRVGTDAAAAHPFFLAASGILRVVSTVTGLAAKAPLFDAALALVPGLDAQSRIANNPELRRLRGNTGGADFSGGAVRYFAIKSNFEPQAIGWNFLRVFSKPMQRLADWGAEVVFQGANDLVVDTDSMDEVADQARIVVAHDFGTSDSVHHTNYFRQPETAAAIRRSFGIP